MLKQIALATGDQRAALSSVGLTELVRGLLGGVGHDVAGIGGEAGAFELDGYVADAEVVKEFVLDGGENLLAFVHVHIGNARVAGKGVVAAAEGPDVDVV